VLRCARCGTRWTDASPPLRVADCTRCGAAVVGAEPSQPHCAACGGKQTEPDGLERELVLAAAGELRRAIAAGWRFVGCDGLSRYLDRVCRDVARVVPSAPAATAVHVTDEERVESLALPSGTIVLSRGLLGSLADEAELAFALGRELTHATSGADAVIGAGLRATAKGAFDDPWLRAAEELVRLGWGEEREHAADAGGLAVLLALGYEPGSARRWLTRLEERAARGDAALAVRAVAHPATAARLQRLRSLESARGEDCGPGRKNREVFRRAAGHSVLAYELRPVVLEPASHEPARSRPIGWIVLAVAALLSVLLLLLRS